MKLSTEAIELLLVEDNMDDAELILRILKKKRFFEKTHHVLDGEEALKVLINENHFVPADMLQPKLIILDIKMPKIDGFTVLEKLRSNAATRLIPVLVFSSSRHERDILKAYESGANSFVVKPLEYDLFVSTVEHIIEFWLNINTSSVKI